MHLIVASLVYSAMTIGANCMPNRVETCSSLKSKYACNHAYSIYIGSNMSFYNCVWSQSIESCTEAYISCSVPEST